MHDTENDLKTCHRPRCQHNSITRHLIVFMWVSCFWCCVLQVRVTAMADTNSQTDLIWGCHALMNVNQWSMTYFTTLNNYSATNDPVKIHLMVS